MCLAICLLLFLFFVGCVFWLRKKRFFDYLFVPLQRIMRRMLLMTRMLTALCAVCLTVLLNWQSKDDVLAEIPLQPAESTVMVPLQQHHHEATLTDASQLYRVCSSRPQRILSSQGSKTERAITPFGNFALRQHIVKHFNSYYDSRCRRETAPFCILASCDYYVIALRHIIR